MLIAASQQELVESMTETDYGMLDSVRWSGSDCMRRNAFLISKACFLLSLRGNGCLVEFFGVFFFFGVSFFKKKHLQFMNEASELGVDALVIFEINFSITIDLMGVSQVLWTMRSSSTVENMWPFDYVLFLLNGNLSVRESTAINHWIGILLFLIYLTTQIMKFSKVGINYSAHSHSEDL